MDVEQQKRINILEYWRTFESFVMPTIEDEKPPAGIERKPSILRSDADLPWPLEHKLVTSKKEESDFVFNVYLGLVEQSLISDKIQKMLNEDEAYYELNSSKSLTCLAGFVLDEQGRLLDKSYITPDYLKSLYALEKFDEQNGEWDQNYTLVETLFDEIGTAFSNESVGSLTFEAITAHLKCLLALFDCLDDKDMKFQAVAHVKKIKAPRDLQEIEINEVVDNPDADEESREKHENEKNRDDTDDKKDEDDEEQVRKTSLDVLPSCFIDDLSRVINSIKKQPCGDALKTYLNDKAFTPRKDVYRDRSVAKTLLNPTQLPLANWPNPGGHSLSFAQQLAVNVALSEKKGLFSVNGPPGTGKTTLLRDIVSDVLVRRAKILAGFEKPLDAFVGTTRSHSRENFRLKTTKLDEKLLGYELVVAASNNNAAENISKELPKVKAINSKWLNKSDENQYFPEVASYYLDPDNKGSENEYWGSISAVLGKSENVYNFFNHFWNRKRFVNYMPL